MDGGHYVRSKSGFDEFSALFGYAKCWTEQRLGRSGAESHNHLWLDQRDFGLEPGTASSNFLSIGFFVNAAFATRLPFEMFDNISDVSLRAIDTRFVERIIKKPTGGTNEGLSRKIFFIAGLFADKHHHSAATAFAEDSLRTSFPEVASFAAGGGRAQSRQS